MKINTGCPPRAPWWPSLSLALSMPSSRRLINVARFHRNLLKFPFPGLNHFNWMAASVQLWKQPRQASGEQESSFWSPFPCSTQEIRSKTRLFQHRVRNFIPPSTQTDSAREPNGGKTCVSKRHEKTLFIGGNKQINKSGAQSGVCY